MVIDLLAHAFQRGKNLERFYLAATIEVEDAECSLVRLKLNNPLVPHSKVSQILSIDFLRLCGSR
jgi:hypothetical protein